MDQKKKSKEKHEKKKQNKKKKKRGPGVAMKRFFTLVPSKMYIT